jgi:hypothetical protein
LPAQNDFFGGLIWKWPYLSEIKCLKNVVNKAKGGWKVPKREAWLGHNLAKGRKGPEGTGEREHFGW